MTRLYSTSIATGFCAGSAATNAVTAVWRALFADQSLTWIGPSISAVAFAAFAVISWRMSPRENR